METWSLCLDDIKTAYLSPRIEVIVTVGAAMFAGCCYGSCFINCKWIFM